LSIDYLQIVRGDYLHQKRTEIVGQISNDLKQIAKEFDCPVVCLSQLNRSVETREDKRPMMSDLRDSDNIEQAPNLLGKVFQLDEKKGAEILYFHRKKVVAFPYYLGHARAGKNFLYRVVSGENIGN